MHPPIDASRAIAKLGIDAPTIKWTPTRQHAARAVVRAEGRNSVLISSELQRDNSHLTHWARAEMPAVRSMAHDDFVRFAVAHELAHLYQAKRAGSFETYVTRALEGDAVARRTGRYRDNPMEHEADVIAERIYKLVDVAV